VKAHKVGDLVHIPQAVTLIDCENNTLEDPQLTIPLRVLTTDSPQIGVVTESAQGGGYVRIFSNGDSWAVKDECVYSLRKGDK
jgi:hypothetical protein